MDISVIIPILDEEENLNTLYDRLISTLGSMGRPFEIVFADDGSRDRSSEILESISSSDRRVKLVTLPANQGQHKAILAGFEHSTGDIVVTLDGDLQNHPEDIPRLVAKTEQGYDVVSGWRRWRRDRFYRKLISWLLSWLASRLTGVALRDYGCMLRAYRRWVFQKLRLFGDRSIFIPTFVSRFGVKVAEVEIGHSPRMGGRSKYSPSKLLNLYFDLISDVSLFPPWPIRILGAFLSVFRSEGTGRRSEPSSSHHMEGTLRRSGSARICVFAYGEIGYVSLEELIGQGEDVVAVITHKDDPGETIWFRSVRELAARSSIPVYEPEDVNDPDFVSLLKELEPDLILSFTYRQILSKEILNIPPLGCINLHPSLLPKYRGRCPANWVLINGQRKTGVTLHYMEERVDAGDIVGQREVEITEDETIKTLYEKLTGASIRLLRDTLPKVKSRQAERVPQNEEEATYFGGRTPEDGRIDWGKSSQEVYNLVRGVTHPYPGAFFYFGEEKIYCWKASLGNDSGEPGQVLRIEKGKGILVACGEGSLVCRSLQFEGGDEEAGDLLAGTLGIVEGDGFS